MEKIIVPRGMGKTRYLIKKAAKTGATMVVHSHKMIFLVQDWAKELGFKIEKPVEFSDFVRREFREVNPKGYLIDDLDSCLTLLNHNVKVLAISMSDENDVIDIGMLANAEE